ncbi:ribonuclease III [Christensenellaceae bacterium OttesenSCG-928-M15]|nr:ribonuclease III [Christensenellaceae bacterium OttesenSCG-928-M15]
MTYSKDLVALQQKIGYTFLDAGLLLTALTHTSFVKGDGKGSAHNERLEFLGDAVLELIISAQLYKRYPQFSEGAMTRSRAAIVCESSLDDLARTLSLQDYLLLGHGEDNSGGRDKPSIVSDALEAVIGAIYIDGGFLEAERFVLRLTEEKLKTLKKRSESKDHKSALQEYVQKNHLGAVSYKLMGETGPDHKKLFTMRVLIDCVNMGEGTGNSKQEAGQQAAAMALRELHARSGAPE